MICPSCRTRNIQPATFCTTCATPLKNPDTASPAETPDCIQCHEQLTPGARFCASCGAPQLPVIGQTRTAESGQHAQSGLGKLPARAEPNGQKGGLRKWLPMVAILLVGCVLGSFFAYQMQPGVPGNGSSRPAVASSDAEAANKNTHTSSTEARPEARKTTVKAARTETRDAAPVANNVQACEQESNLFKRETCMFRACHNRWGTGGCPSYDNNQKAW